MIPSDIISLIPQRPPFVMVDQLITSDEKLTRTITTVKAGNLFVQDGILREPGLLENIAQTAAAGAGFRAKTEGKPVRIGYIGSVRNLQITGFPKVNEEIITEVIVENQVFDVSVVSGKVTCNGKVLAQCEMKIFITNQ